MNLTKSQKKFIKKNWKQLSLSELAVKIGLSENDLKNYLETNIPKEKLAKKTLQNLKPELTSCLVSNWKIWLMKNLGVFIFLSALVFAVYVNSLGNEFLSDDIAGIVQDKNMGNILYYLTHNTINFSRYFFYSIVFKIFGLNPTFFRLINIFFHLGNVFLIYLILNLINKKSLAFFTASIFAVHPLLSESIVWVTGGIYAQYTFFMLLSIFFYLLSRNKDWSLKNYILSVIFFIPALFTTEKAAVLPGLLFAYELCSNQLKNNWKRLIPYFLLSLMIACMVFLGEQFGQRVNALQTSYYQEKGFYNPLTQIPTAIASYLELMIWPDKLTLYHSEMVFTNGQYAIMFLVTLLYFSLIIYCFIKKKYRIYSFWLVFFFISLMPMLTPLKVAWIVAERYVYLGSIGIIFLFAVFIEKIGGLLKNKYCSYLILGIILTALSIRTIVRNVDWKNQDNLWIAAGRTSPSSPQNHNNLGDLYSRRGDFEKAAEEFKIAIALLPNYGDAYHNLANVYLQMNKIDLAIESYQKALTFNPGLWQSHQNLAAIYAQQNRLDLTVEHLQKAVEISPQNPRLHLNMGIIYLNLDKKEEARQEFLKTLQLEPGNADAQKFLQTVK